MKTSKDIGSEIKTIRKESGLSQIEFANEIGISQPHLSRVENGFESVSKPVQKLIQLRFGSINGGDKQ